MNHCIPILMYHQVTPDVNPNYIDCIVTPRMFKIHMNILMLLRFTPINLTQLQGYRDGKSILPDKPVLITFDDCYQECIDHAVPVLKEHGFTAVFYIPTDYVGTDSHWLIPELGFEFPIINWETARYLDSNGFQIGSHSLSHPRLAKISPNDCFRELDNSRKILEDKLGHEVVHLAYPYGSYDENVRRIAAEAGYHTACTIEERFSRLNDDPLLLPRIAIFGYYNIFDFILKLHLEGKYNTTRSWWQYIDGKRRGITRLVKKMSAKIIKNDY